jgi:hypothetical protein
MTLNSDQTDQTDHIHFRNYICDPVFKQYGYGGGLAITLVSAIEDTINDVMVGEQIAHATINLDAGNGPNQLPRGYIAIKDYSENTGMLDALIKAGYIEPPVSTVVQGFVTNIPICKLTEKAQLKIDEQLPLDKTSR